MQRPVSVVLSLLVLASACTAPDLEPLSAIEWLPEELELGSGQLLSVVTSEGEYPLDLKTLLRLAGTKPLEIEIARAQAQAALAEENMALSQWLPSLRPALAFWRHEGQIQSTEGLFLDVDKQSSFVGGGLSLNLNFADAWYRSLEAARRARAAALGVQASQQLNVGLAVRRYYDLLQEQASLQIAAQTIDQARELVAVEEARERQGRGLPAQVLRAKAFLAASEGQLAVFQGRVGEANAELAALLLLPEGVRLVSSEERIRPIRFAEAELELPELLQRAYASRPDLKQARKLQQAAEAERGRADWSWLLPQLRLGAEHGSFGAAPTRAHGREDYYAALEWELGFQGMATAQLADAEYRQAVTRVELMRQRVRVGLQRAKVRLRAAQAQMAAALRQVEAAAASSMLVQARHKEGRALLLEVMDAERASSEAKINLVRAICEQNRAQFELRRQLGG